MSMLYSVHALTPTQLSTIAAAMSDANDACDWHNVTLQAVLKLAADASKARNDGNVLVVLWNHDGLAHNTFVIDITLLLYTHGPWFIPAPAQATLSRVTLACTASSMSCGIRATASSTPPTIDRRHQRRHLTSVPQRHRDNQLNESLSRCSTILGFFQLLFRDT